MNEKSHLGFFFFDFLSFFLHPCNQIWAKSNGAFYESTFCWSERAGNLQNTLLLWERLKKKGGKESVAFKAGPWWDSKCSESCLCWETEMYFQARPYPGHRKKQTICIWWEEKSMNGEAEGEREDRESWVMYFKYFGVSVLFSSSNLNKQDWPTSWFWTAMP